MIVKEAPPLLIIRGVIPGKKIEVLRRRGRLYLIRCGFVDLVIDEELFEKIIVQ